MYDPPVHPERHGTPNVGVGVQLTLPTMGLSLSRVYQSLTALSFWGKDKEVRILMVGLDSAGKTTILYRLQVRSTLSISRFDY